MISTRIVVMGVSGAGKTTVGIELASQLKLPFEDADGLHPAPNVAKMAAGIPLTDEDRWPWLHAVGARVASADGIVMACSALTRAYRDAIRTQSPDVAFVLLAVDRAELDNRVRHRPGHFMPASLLDSQLETLEPLGADERGVTVPAVGGVAATAGTIVSLLRG